MVAIRHGRGGRIKISACESLLLTLSGKSQNLERPTHPYPYFKDEEIRPPGFKKCILKHTGNPWKFSATFRSFLMSRAFSILLTPAAHLCYEASLLECLLGPGSGLSVLKKLPLPVISRVLFRSDEDNCVAQI